MSTVISLKESILYSDLDLRQKLRQNYDAVGIEELETKLREAIEIYRGQQKRGSGYRALCADIEAKLHAYLEDQGYTQQEIEKIVQARVPGFSYIQKFSNGTNICINYMNTLAFFFNIKFTVSNFKFN